MRTIRTAAGLGVAALAIAACGGTDPVPTAAAPTTSSSTTAPSTTTTPPPTTTSTTTAPRTTTTTAKPRPSTTSAAAPKPKPAPRPAPVTSLAAVPRAGAEPTVRFPKNAAASGSGANAQVSAVPDSVWDPMVDYSWTPGCPVGRTSLRYVAVNFWGFDGKRSRGGLVVHRDIAADTAAAFTSLYDQQFRIRQMRPMDSSWGHNPKGPGADDYAAMEADNTSAFNCRYVGGMEQTKRYSNHAYGKAIDINDFENPYVADDGRVYPDPYFVSRRGPAPGVFSSSSSGPVRAFTSRGFEWGGRWANPDYQHFDR